MIKFNEVTWYSRILTFVVTFAVVPLVSFYVGTQYEKVMSMEQGTSPYEIPTRDPEYPNETETQDMPEVPISTPVAEDVTPETQSTTLEELVVIRTSSTEIVVPKSLQTDTIKPLIQTINTQGASFPEREASFRDLIDEVSNELACTNSNCVSAQVNRGCGARVMSVKSVYDAEEINFFNNIYAAWQKEFHVVFEC